MSRTVQTFVVAPEGKMEAVLKFIADTTTGIEFTQYGGSIKLNCAYDDSLDPLLDALEAEFGDMQEGICRKCDRPSEWK